jgi:hypothetical protein
MCGETQAVAVFQAHIQQNQVGSQLLDQNQGSQPICGLTHDVHIALQIDEFTHCITHPLHTVSQQDSYGEAV